MKCCYEKMMWPLQSVLWQRRTNLCSVYTTKRRREFFLYLLIKFQRGLEACQNVFVWDWFAIARIGRMEATSSLDLMRKHRLGLWPSFAPDKLFAHLIMFFSSIAPCVLVAITSIFISIHHMCNLYFSLLKLYYTILKKTLYMRRNTFEISFLYDGFGCNKRETLEKYVIWIEQ